MKINAIFIGFVYNKRSTFCFYLLPYMLSSLHPRKRKNEMFYLTTHSTHFIYGYMVKIFSIYHSTDRKEGNILFNDALNTFYIRLYGVIHMVKDHSDSERKNPLPPHRLLFPISSKGYFICIIPQTG